jgi:RsiW-degrading membrane proteinase PrsW (M82 family)
VIASHSGPEPDFSPRIPEPKPAAAKTAPGQAPPRPAPALATPSPEGSASRLRSLQRFVYLVLLLALIPLAYSTLTRNADEFSQRLERTLEAHPESREKVDELSKDEFLDLLPDHRLEGALLSADSWAHWGFALLSSGVFFAVLLVIFPRGRREVPGILAVGAFTATIGIVLLLGFQAVADWTQGTWVTGRSILVIFFYLAKFIGFSYRAALDPENGFLLSCLGFTFGVGLCEEMCKALPLLYRYKSRELPWKTACLWGLASGVGFGVSEGITYSSNFYNGIQGGEIYLVRFASCVALHAVWSGAAAIVIHRKQHLLQNADSWWHFLGTSVLLVSVPMALHGVYDTLLKKDHEALALATALASFGWLAWQIEVIWKLYGDVEETEVPKVPAAAQG